jgi:uncharacterized SAM-binding protein YcdF (DUF218 family)
MLFVVSKLLDFFFVPSNLIGMLALLSLAALIIGYRRTATAASLLMALLVIVLGWSPLGPAALMALENRFPPPQVTGEVAGIVMLGGAVETHITEARRQVALTDAGERVTVTAELARRFPEARVVLSGGASDLLGATAETESALARDVMVAAGLPADRVELEERSRDTCENAAESKNVATPRPGEQWLLVTSVSHMPRAIACFKAAGKICGVRRAQSPLVLAMPTMPRMNGSASLPIASPAPVSCSLHRNEPA